MDDDKEFGWISLMENPVEIPHIEIIAIEKNAIKNWFIEQKN